MLGTYVQKMMNRADLSARSLGAKLGHSSNGLVSGVINGESSIPLDKIDEWALHLNLSETEKQEFKGLCIARRTGDKEDRSVYIEKYSKNRAKAERRAYFMAAALVKRFISQPDGANFLLNWMNWPDDEQGAEGALRTLLDTLEKSKP